MDLYEELIEEKEADSNATKAENASLKAEVAKLKEDNKNLWIINTDLSEKLKRASTNITALIKTCRAELNRYVCFWILVATTYPMSKTTSKMNLLSI